MHAKKRDSNIMYLTDEIDSCLMTRDTGEGIVDRIAGEVDADARKIQSKLGQDIIRYSISDDSIRHFVEKLNCIDNLTIKQVSGNHSPSDK